MKPGLTVSRCRASGIAYFPPRLVCPESGSADMAEDVVMTGTVEEMTVVRHAIGQENWSEKHIATVRLPEGQLVVAGADQAMAEGSTVDLFEEEGCPVIRKARES